MNLHTKIHKNNWWHQTKNEVAQNLNTDALKGLSHCEAKKRLQDFGLNQLIEQKKKSPVFLLFNQFSNLMIWILMIAAMISGVLNDWIDAFAILAIIILNTLIGFFQEYKAERSLAALVKMVNPTSKVIRDGRLQSILSKEIVPGDLVLIEAGDRIPADGRLIRLFGLATQEAALTGESISIHKAIDSLEAPDPSLSDKKNMGFMGTIVVSGKGYMIVTETGIHTELGKIASLLHQGDEEKTPLQISLNQLGVRLVWVCLGIAFLIFGLGYLKSIPFVENLLFSVSLVVAAIPEGLPAIVTIALSIGTHRMAKRNALLRYLPSVETLGCTTVICTDKTGTLTQNALSARTIWVNNRFVDIAGTGYSLNGNFEINHNPIDPQQIPELIMCLKIGILCNSAEMHRINHQSNNWDITGDPTEGALLIAAGKANLFKQDLEINHPLISELPFDPDRKRMSMLRQTPEGTILFIKGAADTILTHADSILMNGKIQPLNAEYKQNLIYANAYLASQALRVLAVGYRPIQQNSKLDHSMEDQLIIVGLIAMMDPPRPEVKSSIETCRNAGITTIMITGDHKETAIAVAKEINLLTDDSIVLTGSELDQLSEEDLRARLRIIRIYARATAAHKLRIVKAWKSKGEIIAMTGDGVNDAPALKEAHIGISMGITGTDVTKEASDMVIVDDNFASIVNAIEEGRGIYDNITKFVSYLATSNISEIIVIFLGLLIGFTDSLGNPMIPLSAVQILWINLASDGLPSIAMGMDPVDPNVMKRFPRNPAAQLISREKALYLVSISFVIAFGTLTAFYYGLQKSPLNAQTMGFTTLVVLELAMIQVIRTPYNLSFFSNPLIIVAISASLILQLLIIYTPFFQSIFNTTPLNLNEWGMIALITLIVWIVSNWITCKIKT